MTFWISYCKSARPSLASPAYALHLVFSTRRVVDIEHAPRREDPVTCAVEQLFEHLDGQGRCVREGRNCTRETNRLCVMFLKIDADRNRDCRHVRKKLPPPHVLKHRRSPCRGFKQ